MQVEIWTDVVCPWCYLGKRHLDRALELFPHRDAVEVTYRSFELDPAAPPGVKQTVEMLAAKYGMTLAQAGDAQRQMEQRASQYGLTFRNRRPAQRQHPGRAPAAAPGQGQGHPAAGRGAALCLLHRPGLGLRPCLARRCGGRHRAGPRPGPRGTGQR